MSRMSRLMLTTGALAGAGLLMRAVVRRQRHMPLEGRVALVTGGSRGLGLELARQLIEKDMRVAICARSEVELRQAQEDLQQRHPLGLFAGVCDVTDRRAVEQFVEQAREELGPIDVLINNAGIITVGPFDTVSRSEIQQSFATHVSAPMEFIRAVLPDMRRRGGGRIVNIASIGGKVPVPHLAAYAASKHALVGLSESLRAELAQENIFVTTVNPGMMRTGSPWRARFKGDPQAEFAWFASLANLPLVSISTPRIASRIIDALEHGAAELTTPCAARFAAAMHGAFSGLGTEVAALQARLLPSGRHIGSRQAAVQGREADVGQLPDVLEKAQARNAERFHEV